MALLLDLLDLAEHDSGGRKHGREGGSTGERAEARARGREHGREGGSIGNEAEARMKNGHTGKGGSRAHGEEQTHSYARSTRMAARQQPALREKYGSQQGELRWGRLPSKSSSIAVRVVTATPRLADASMFKLI
jgi:hypothetical protein